MWRLVAYVGQVRWCWFIDEVVRAEDKGDLAPSLMSTVTCEDVLLMKISIDTLRGGKARFGEVKEFARNYLGITSHRVLYRMLNRLCGYGLVKFSRGSTCGLSDYDCTVTKTGCRITEIKPTVVGLILASATSLAYFTYLDMFTKYREGKFDGESGRIIELIRDSVVNLFNMEQLRTMAGDADAQWNMYEAAANMHEAAVNTIMGMGEINLLMTLANALGLNTPEEAYSFRVVVFSGYVKKFLRFLLNRFRYVALTSRAGGPGVGCVEGLIEDMLNDRVENINIGNRRYWDLIEAMAKIRMYGARDIIQSLLQ